MSIIKADALAKARSHFEFFSEARDERAFVKLLNGAQGYCQALWKVGVIDAEELAQLLADAEIANQRGSLNTSESKSN